MYVSPYFFDGEPPALTAAHRRMIAEHFPAQTLSPHAPLWTGTSFPIPEDCPSNQVQDTFPASPEFRGALAAVGPPEPRIEPPGDVEWLHVTDSAMPV